MNFFVAASLPGSYARSMKYLCPVHSGEKDLDDVRDSECVPYCPGPHAPVNERTSA